MENEIQPHVQTGRVSSTGALRILRARGFGGTSPFLDKLTDLSIRPILGQFVFEYLDLVIFFELYDELVVSL